MYRHTECYPGDPILSLVETFKNDPRPEKINLSIGIHFDGGGKMPVLEPVSRAETAHAAMLAPSPYLLMEGSNTYRSAMQCLLFDKDNHTLAQGRVATVQTLGGSGALKVGANFLYRWFPEARAYVSDPAWDNHRGIFEGAGFGVGTYPYYDPITAGVKFDKVTAFFNTLPEHSILILHPCCHSPTGVDMLEQQWDEVLQTTKTRKLIPFMDITYQGFGGDLDSDAYTTHKVVEMDLPLFVSNSFSKDLLLCGDHVGGLNVVCPNKEEAELVFEQLKFTVRRIYSSPSAHGVYIAADVMNSPELYALWQNEIYVMRDRIHAMRQKLYDVLSAQIPSHDFTYFIRQRGTFSYTGLSMEQVRRLRDEFAVYLLDSGRMCVAESNASNIAYVADVFAEVLK